MISHLDTLIDAIEKTPCKKMRKFVALSGPPASGKSTLAAILAQRLKHTKVVSMDGFHMSNNRLARLNLLSRKGAPETFNFMDFKRLLTRLTNTTKVKIPLFDRTTDRVIKNAIQIDSACKIIIVEGNYLLYNSKQWRDLYYFWDYKIFIKVNLDVLQDRLLHRWLTYGMTHAQAIKRTKQNDLVNAKRVQSLVLPYDWEYTIVN